MNDAWVLEGLESDLGAFHLGPVDLTVGAGGAAAVLGASGAGKTTLLRTIAGFLPARRGRILRDGIDLTDRPPEERGLGYVPQGLGLLPHRTVERNVRYPMEIRGRPGAEADARTRELLERFRLAPLARRYPSRLSGGEQQRVAIARALAADPALIVWDEPWQGLDLIARHELGLVLHDLRATEGVPVVVVTHDPALAFSIADTFLVLREGKVQDRCDAATLIASPADPFAARFVGYENVYAPSELAGGAPAGLRAWLAERAGPSGVAFARAVHPPAAGTAARWEGTVRSVRPSPSGVMLEIMADGLLVGLTLAIPGPTPPALGARIRFDLPEPSLLRLGPRTRSGGS